MLRSPAAPRSCPAPSVFSYHAILSSRPEAESTSTSPSPSTSAAKTDQAKLLRGSRSPAGHRSSPAPSVFSYHAILSSPRRGGEHVQVPVAVHIRRKDGLGGSSAEVEITCCGAEAARAVRVLVPRDLVVVRPRRRARRCPRPRPRPPRRRTVRASARVEITCWAPKLPAPSVFSYHAILSSSGEAESTSSVPVAVQVRREDGPGAVGEGRDHLLRAEAPRPVRVLVPRDLVVEERTRRARPCPRPRPRPPRRRIGPRRRGSRSPAGRRSSPRRPCSRTTRSRRRVCEAESTSVSPSPSTSAAKTDRRRLSARVEITCWGAEAPGPQLRRRPAGRRRPSRRPSGRCPPGPPRRCRGRRSHLLSSKLAVDRCRSCPRRRRRGSRAVRPPRSRRTVAVVIGAGSRGSATLSCSYQAILSSSEAESTSVGPRRPSTSAAKTDSWSRSKSRVEIVLAGPRSPRVRPCSRTTRSCRRSRRRARPGHRRRPRPPRRPIKGPSARVEITCWGPKLPDPVVFSYHAILSSYRRGGEHVHVPIAVHVRREDGGAPSASVEITCWRAEAPAVRVLVPRDLVVVRTRPRARPGPRPRPHPPRRRRGH